jgi:tight adherence protein B
LSIEALLAVLSAAGAACLVLGVPRLLTTDTRWLDVRLRRYGARPFELTDEEQRNAASVAMTQLIANRVEASVSGRTFAAKLRADLARANLKVTVGEFLIVQASAAATCGAFAFFISRAPAVACFFATAGWFMPKIWLGRRKSARLKAFNDQLADTIALMSNSLRSGMSLLQSMEMITREARPPVSEEFHRVVREVGLGVGPQEALLHVVERVDSEDLDLLVTAILVQFEIGGNLSRILDSIAGTIRERIKLHGEIRTLSAQGRMSGYILSGMPVAIAGLLMLVAPSYMGKLFSPGPWLVLPVVAVFGIGIGTLVLQKLVAIEV